MPKYYSTVSIPNQLIKKLDKIIEAKIGYTSKSEFIKEAIREKLDKIRMIHKENFEKLGIIL